MTVALKSAIPMPLGKCGNNAPENMIVEKEVAKTTPTTPTTIPEMIELTTAPMPCAPCSAPGDTSAPSMPCSARQPAVARWYE